MHYTDQVSPERAEAIQKLYEKIPGNENRSIGGDMDGSCGFSQNYETMAKELNEIRPADMEEITEDEVGIVCEEYEEVRPCADCGWHDSSYTYLEDEGAYICWRCEEDREDNGEDND